MYLVSVSVGARLKIWSKSIDVLGTPNVELALELFRFTDGLAERLTLMKRN